MPLAPSKTTQPGTAGPEAVPDVPDDVHASLRARLAQDKLAGVVMVRDDVVLEPSVQAASGKRDARPQSPDASARALYVLEDLGEVVKVGTRLSKRVERIIEMPAGVPKRVMWHPVAHELQELMEHDIVAFVRRSDLLPMLGPTLQTSFGDSAGFGDLTSFVARSGTVLQIASTVQMHEPFARDVLGNIQPELVVLSRSYLSHTSDVPTPWSKLAPLAKCVRHGVHECTVKTIDVHAIVDGRDVGEIPESLSCQQLLVYQGTSGEAVVVASFGSLDIAFRVDETHVAPGSCGGGGTGWDMLSQKARIVERGTQAYFTSGELAGTLGQMRVPKVSPAPNGRVCVSVPNIADGLCVAASDVVEREVSNNFGHK